tara:strand:- start:1361 stop:1681 length:321 start_codon:yes stop_codon:yes gene_type:complete
MLKIIGLIIGLVLPDFAVASNQISLEIPMHCVNTVPCKLIQRDDCGLQNRQRGIFLSDLLTASQAKITQSLKTVTESPQQQGAQPLSYVATGLLKSKHMAMLFPVR